MIKWHKTDRGFKRGNFIDRYGQGCSIQESSLATESALWLGADAGVHVDGDPEKCCARMHLTKDMARELGARLLVWAERDVLGPPEAPLYIARLDYEIEGHEYWCVRKREYPDPDSNNEPVAVFVGDDRAEDMAHDIARYLNEREE